MNAPLNQANLCAQLAASPQEGSAVSPPVHFKREHDMRNLVYLITSFTQLLSDGLAGPVTPKQKEFLSHVLDCAGNIWQLLNTATPAPSSNRPQTGHPPGGNSAQPACS